jgi:hypothetical protein
MIVGSIVSAVWKIENRDPLSSFSILDDDF